MNLKNKDSASFWCAVFFLYSKEEQDHFMFVAKIKHIRTPTDVK
ncbi:hypothetical protein NC99_16450 [Sunxiuqinia dokdonensis]|uniref:Uncharacterized protein n=1 Tax=Sunxiuqinia dokdonensis TaxID=1409788 RepID=A0A0L8VAM9_9BACT|nr:hypothetical protein NC99_16450 [Sunxiuqinia dokdonensis]